MPQAGTTGPAIFCLWMYSFTHFSGHIYWKIVHVAYEQEATTITMLSFDFIHKMCDKFLQYAQNVWRTQIYIRIKWAWHIEWQMFEHEFPAIKKSSWKKNLKHLQTMQLFFIWLYLMHIKVFWKKIAPYFLHYIFFHCLNEKRTTLIEHIIHMLTWLWQYHKTCQHMWI